MELQTTLTGIGGYRHPEKEPTSYAGQLAFCKLFQRARKSGNSILASYLVALYNWRA